MKEWNDVEWCWEKRIHKRMAHGNWMRFVKYCVRIFRYLTNAFAVFALNLKLIFNKFFAEKITKVLIDSVENLINYDGRQLMLLLYRSKIGRSVCIVEMQFFNQIFNRNPTNFLLEWKEFDDGFNLVYYRFSWWQPESTWCIWWGVRSG